jgi:uncharacterized protein (DUF433 family)
MSSQLCIRGHWITAEHLLTMIGAGWARGVDPADFPPVEVGDLQQAAAYPALSARE